MDIEKNRVSLKVWGEFACFTRPEMKVERVSYDVMTPSSARGILEAIYWKPQIRWVIDRITVLNPIQFTNVRRNELGGVGPSDRSLKSYLDGKKGTPLEQVIEEERQLRASTVLKAVSYIIDAYYEVLDKKDPPQKHYEMFKRRATKGQCFQHPYLGCREFVADFTWNDSEATTCDASLKGEKDLGFMLHDIDFSNAMTPSFFRAKMVDGVIDVPAFSSQEVRT